MLKLLLGLAGTGKTTAVLGQLRARAQQGLPSLLLVPEQFSSSAEGMVYRALGDEASAMVEVASFRTLSERILRRCGGALPHVLDDAGRAVYVRRALEAVAGSLRAYARQRRSAAFCSLCAQTLQELKIAGATPEKLRAIAAKEREDKFDEIALIFEAYEAAIAGAAMDPQDRLVQAAAKADCGYLDGRACFIDSFDGFTAPEYALLGPLLRHCTEVTVTLCCNGLAENAAGPDMFSPVRRAAHHLLGLAARAGVPAAAPTVLGQALRPQAPGLAAVGRILAEEGYADALEDDSGPEDGPRADGTGRAVPDAPPQNIGVFLTEAADEWAEVRLAAAEMRRLATAGVPYGKMALVCRDAAHYERVVRRQFALFDIPLFVDAVSTIEYTAPVAFLRAALGLLRSGLVSAQILALLKTGLCGYGAAEIAALENYVFTWQPKAADWRQPFTRHPEGFAQEMNPQAEKQLAAAEGLRAALVPKLEQFIQSARGGSAAKLSRQLYLLMDRFGAAEQAAARAEALEGRGAYDQADRVRRAWDLAMDMLDVMAALVGKETLPAEEYDELLLILVRSTDFGQTPQSLECVTFTTADRMRLAEPDYCFVVGVAEGEFPMQIGYSGLLNHTDRDLLVAGGIEMPGSFENRTLLEEMFFYRALAAPRKGLYLSWPARRGGEGRAMSAALEPVRAALAPPPLALPEEALAATPAAAFDLLGAAYRDDGPLAATLYKVLGEDEETGRSLALLEEVDNPAAFAVPDTEAIRRVVGGQITLSATRAERYYECPFSYYMERLLKVKPRRKAEISPVESGTFVHYVLEQVLREAGAGFPACTDDAIEEMAERHAEAFIAGFLPDDTARGKWRLRCIKQTTVRLLCYLRDAGAQSDFTVDAVELSIGDGPEDDLPPLEVACADGRSLRVTGKVDRVDTLRLNGKTYLCVLDYKTGDKKLTMEDLYCGRNMQMMIYLDTLCKNGGERYENPVPAGVLYLGADPRPVTGGRGGEGGAPFRLEGLLLRDADVLQKMDGSGQFLPVRTKRDGTLAAAGDTLAGPEKIGAIMAHVEKMLAGMAEGVYGGQFPARPLVKGGSRPCAWCPYRGSCRHEDGRDEVEVAAPEDVFEEGWGEGA